MKSPELSNSGLETQIRKSYIKPGIERVSLVPEETVLGGCKQTVYPNTDVFGTDIPNCGLVLGCKDNGS